jgi:hypothetical protein
MNCNACNRRAYLAARICGWREVASGGVDKFERARGRRNLRRLAQAHPDIAAECGMNRHTWLPNHAGSHA